VRIDHVIYATADLDAAAARVGAELGLEVVGGGRHDGLGTHNRIVPLGGGFLELLAVADAEEAAGSDLGRALQQRILSVGDGLMGWAVEAGGVAAIGERLGTDVTSIGRQGMTAHLVGVAESMRDPSLPFFIERDHGIPDPGVNGDAGGITWIEVAGDADRLRSWLGGGELPVRVVAGEPMGVRAMGIGERELRTAG
jgi:catechol 2,3-dioxygenase-like lactoylglutathione lyase family enzyme